MRTQAERGKAFQALHERKGGFVIPNPYDVGTARLLEHFGFEALATTSAGFAYSEGYRDNKVSREATLAHLRAISEATDLPVSADLGHGFGDDPGTVVETLHMVAETGVVGGSIEDSTGRSEDPIYPIDKAVERIRAAAESVRKLHFPFTLTARCENYLVGKKDLKDTIRRLQAYQEAGADVLYAPGLMTREEIDTVVRGVNRPVNVLAGMPKFPLTLAELSALGVKRVSVGSALYHTAKAAFVRAVQEMKERGTFSFANDGASPPNLSEIFRG
jgi:2-methylisocitrate lyase-like PEP mutase family enzyme